MKHFTLSNGVEIPAVGYGSFQATDGYGKRVIKDALEVGYRYIDTATLYRNEAEIGEALAESDVKREEVFLVSKVWPSMLGREETRRAFEDSCRDLKTDYLDMYLIHWPKEGEPDADWASRQAEGWQVMEELYREGRIRAIGVSNFLPHHMKPFLERIEIVPMLNQLELHVGYMQEYAVRYMRELGMVIQAWSPLGRAALLGDERIGALAAKYGKSPAQILLRYLLQREVAVIPKASTPERMKQNLDVFDFELTEEEVFFLSCIPQAGWSGEHPDLM
jgi:diketogulonate reductase-like aldo/keto reductase